MLKKMGVVTALAGTVLFGAAFQSPAHAQSNEGHNYGHVYKIHYTINTDCSNLSVQDFKKYFDQSSGSYHLDWYRPHAEQNQQKDQAKSSKQQKQTPVKQVQQPKQQQQTQSSQKQTQQQSQPKQQQGYQLSQFEQQVVKLTNQERTQRGLQPLKVNISLSKMARDKSQDMANNNYFSHQSPTYGSPFDMMKQYGISYRAAGENIAEGQRTPQEVVNAWMHSPGHRANILNADYTEIGVGYVAQGNIWTQDFIGQ